LDLALLSFLYDNHAPCPLERSWKLAGSRKVASQNQEHQRDIVQDRLARIRASLQVSPYVVR
jgi:hypothetical protein